jgi:uncharacterized membrane protein YfcA
MNAILLILLGVFAGVLSGFLGIGGATIIVPALVLIWGFSQHQAQGTTLALMVPPIGLLAAIKYYSTGSVNLGFAGFICIGFFVGALIGATLVQPVPDVMLRKIFGVFFALVAMKMIFF